MLLIDEVERDGNTSVGRCFIRGDEFFLRGHFPNNPVVPGVILCEMMGQSACLLVEREDGGETWTPYFTGMNHVKFKRKVHPGDNVEFRTELIKRKDAFYFIRGEGYVGEKLCVSAELSFAAVKEE
jgi:3-hydroxyacyl-[acyl-carrier-protein] dehydratase